MKLAVEVTTCTAERTGVGYYTEHLVDALIATAPPGDEVTLIGNRELAPTAARKWAGRLRTGGAQLRYLWMQRDAGRMLEEAGADFALFPNYLAPLAPPCPYVNVVHDLALIRTPQFFNARKRALMRPLLPIVARGAVAVGTVSEASRRDVIALLGVPEERIVMLPGAPHPACRPPDEAAIARVRARYGIARPYILTVGTLEPRKNLPLLLQAFDRLRATSRLAGRRARSGDRRRQGLARSRAARRAGAAHRLGARAPARLRPGGRFWWRSTAARWRWPTRRTSKGSGCRWWRRWPAGRRWWRPTWRRCDEVSGGAAILVPPGDDAALAAELAALAENPSARAAARARGLARAATFSWSTAAERLWALAHETRARRTIPRRAATAGPVVAPPAGRRRARLGHRRHRRLRRSVRRGRHRRRSGALLPGGAPRCRRGGAPRRRVPAPRAADARRRGASHLARARGAGGPAQRRHPPDRRAAGASPARHRGAGRAAVRPLAGAVGRDRPPKLARRRRHRSVRGDRRREGLHHLHAAVPGQPPHPHARRGLPELPGRREQPADRLSPRSLHRAPGAVAGAHRRARHLRALRRTPTAIGCAISIPPTSRAPAATTIGTSGVQRLAERAIASAAPPSSSSWGRAWRFHLGRRAARAPARRPGGLGRDPEAAPL